MTKRLAFVLPDAPGYFVALARDLGAFVQRRGHVPLFIAPSRYYERFKGVELSSIGEVIYLSDETRAVEPEEIAAVELDYWLAHPTFVRQEYFLGHHMNTWDSYRRATLVVREILSQHRLDVIWSEIPSGALLRITHTEASRLGIPYIGYATGRLPEVFNVARDAYGVEFEVNPHPASKVRRGQGDYMSNPLSTLHERRLLVEIKRVAQFKRARDAFIASGEKSIETGSTWPVQVSFALRQIQRKVRQIYATPGQFDSLPDQAASGLRILFPLHYRPEASTSVQAEFYHSDLQTIRNIAFSLPHGAELWVKEHPTAIGNRSRRWYREIRALPATHMIGPTPSASEILDSFDAVVTLTSTVGYEALEAGVPVLLLGRTFYEGYPGVTRVESWESLRTELRSLLPREPIPDPFSAYWRTCFPGSFNYMSPDVLSPANIDRLAQPLLDALS